LAGRQGLLAAKRRQRFMRWVLPFIIWPTNLMLYIICFCSKYMYNFVATSKICGGVLCGPWENALMSSVAHRISVLLALFKLKALEKPKNFCFFCHFLIASLFWAHFIKCLFTQLDVGTEDVAMAWNLPPIELWIEQWRGFAYGALFIVYPLLIVSQANWNVIGFIWGWNLWEHGTN